VAEAGEHVGEDHGGDEAVGDAPGRKTRGGKHELRVGGLEQHEIERAGAHVFDDGGEAWADGAFEHALQQHEPRHHQERFVLRPSGQGGAFVEHHHRGRSAITEP